MIDDQAVLDSVNPPGPNGWWTAVDLLEGRWPVILCHDDVDLTNPHLGARLNALSGTGRAVFAAVPVRTKLSG